MKVKVRIFFDLHLLFGQVYDLAEFPFGSAAKPLCFALKAF